MIGMDETIYYDAEDLLVKHMKRYEISSEEIGFIEQCGIYEQYVERSVEEQCMLLARICYYSPRLSMFMLHRLHSGHICRELFDLDNSDFISVAVLEPTYRISGISTLVSERMGCLYINGAKIFPYLGYSSRILIVGRLKKDTYVVAIGSSKTIDVRYTRYMRHLGMNLSYVNLNDFPLCENPVFRYVKPNTILNIYSTLALLIRAHICGLIDRIKDEATRYTNRNHTSNLDVDIAKDVMGSKSICTGKNKRLSEDVARVIRLCVECFDIDVVLQGSMINYYLYSLLESFAYYSAIMNQLTFF